MMLDTVTRYILTPLAPSGSRARLTILIFHRVLSSPDPLFPDEVECSRFDAVIGWLNRWFNILPLEEAAERLAHRSLPARPACITFDDGYADNLTNALPILKRHSAAATFFIATGFLSGGRMWNDTIIEAVRSTQLRTLDLRTIGGGVLGVASDEEKRRAIGRLIGLFKYRDYRERDDIAYAIAESCNVDLPNNLMLDDDGVRKLHNAGMSIGAHTVDHPILRLCDERETSRQITSSREYLEDLVGHPIRLFAYPNGKPGVDYTKEQARLVERLGFLAAVSTHPGASSAREDRFELRRFTPWDRTATRFALRLALNLQRS